MAPRRAHKKSRTGCYTCKRRRVKCDEQGPPCGQCTSRAIECSFSPSNVSLVAAKIRKGDRPVDASVTPPEGAPAAGSATTPAGDAHSNKLFELELMHQWTATTYKCFCGEDVREYHSWQVLVPRMALKHAFLLDGILAIAALEIAVFEKPTHPIKYKQAALEYHGRALSGFRSMLTNVNADNAQAVFAASLFVMILGLAIPQYTTTSGHFHSLIESIITHHELVRGAGLIVIEHKLQGVPLLQYADDYKQRPGRCLQPDVEVAFEHLNKVNEELHDRSEGQNLDARLLAVTNHAACQKAILILANLFRKCQEPLNRGLALAWLNFTGREFVTAIETSNPVALMTLMYWGVLCQQAGVGLWWAQSLGQRIAQQVIPTLPQKSSLAFGAAVSWVQDQVGS